MEGQDLRDEPEHGRVTPEEAKRLEMLLSHFRPRSPARGHRQRVLGPALETLARRQRFGQLAGMWRKMLVGSRGLAAMAAGLLVLVLGSYAVDLHYQRVVEGLAAGPPARAAERDAAVAEDVLKEVLLGARLNGYARLVALRLRLAAPEARVPGGRGARRLILDELLRNGG